MAQTTYRYKCLTEDLNIEETRLTTDPYPTTCINNISHSIDTNTLIILRKAPSPSATSVSTTDTQTLVNKTLTEPIITTISNTGILTLPTSTDTLIGRDTSDTIGNKLLKNDTCYHVDPSDTTKRISFQTSGATTSTSTTLIATQTGNISLTLPISTDTLVGRATTDTLTNKTLTLPNISTI